MGNGYIRYENGLQICYGTVQFTASLTTAWGSLYEATTSSVTSYTFAKAFNKTPWLSATVSSGNAAFIEVAKQRQQQLLLCILLVQTQEQSHQVSTISPLVRGNKQKSASLGAFSRFKNRISYKVKLYPNHRQPFLLR